MSWRKVKLGELVDNFSVKAKDVGGADGLEFFGVSNEVGITKTKYAAEDKAEDYKIIEQHCFAYNPYRVNVGSIGMVTQNIKGLISPAYVVFKPKPNSIKAELLLKFLKSSEGLRQIRFYARGTVRQALRFEDLCNIELSVPDFEEQEVLFEQLNSVEKETDLLNSELTHQQDLLKQLRQAFLRDAMQGKLVKQEKKDGNAKELLEKIKIEKAKCNKKEKAFLPIKEEEIPFDIPDNWMWCRLGEIGRITGGGTPSMANDEYWNGNIPWVSPKDMWTEFVTDTEMKVTKKAVSESSTNLIPEGSLLIVGRSGILKRKLPVAINKVECTVNQDMKVIIPHIITMNRFLQLMLFGLENIILKDFVKFGMTVHSLKYEEFAQMPIPLPPLAEQTRIVKKLEEVINLCEELKTTIEDNQNYTDQLLQGALKDALQPKEVEV
jgi:type I restriction enzyme, S subunit